MSWMNGTKHRDLGLLILRLGMGLVMIGHGVPKLIGGPNVWQHNVGSSLGLYGVTHGGVHLAFGLGVALLEVFGGLLLILGVLFGLVCLLLTLEMLGAMSQHMFNPHFPDMLRTFSAGWGQPLAFAVVFFSLIFIGPGAWRVGRRSL